MAPLSRAVVVACALIWLSACDDNTTDAATAAVEFDPLLSPTLQLGGDLLVTGRVLECTAISHAQLDTPQETLAQSDALTLFKIDPLPGETPDPRVRFQLLVPADTLSPARYGLPLSMPLTLTVQCDGETLVSPAVTFTYLPTWQSFAPSFNANHFWAAAHEGDLLVCDNTSITVWEQGVSAGAPMDVGFPCAVADLSDGIGGQRYLHGEGVGLAAIGDDDALRWSRPLNLVDVQVDPDSDPLLLYDDGDVQLAVLERVDGTTKVGPVSLAYPPLGPMRFTVSGEIVVLEAERQDEPAALNYYVERFAPTGESLGTLLAYQYPWHAPPYLADFSFAGEALYVAAALSEDERFLAKIDLGSGITTWQSPPEAGYLFPLGESYGRLVAATATGFIWLDPATGTPVSESFAPDSGNNFLRGTVEEDGSIVMLADASGNAAQGLYLFAPDGTSTLRLHDPTALFRTLTPAWQSGAIVSFFNEIHWLKSQASYRESLTQAR